MPQRVVRVGLVGFGWFGRLHAQAWQNVRDAELVGLCDLDPIALGLNPAGPASGSAAAPQDTFHRDLGGRVEQVPDDVLRVTRLADLLSAGIDVLDVVTSEPAHVDCVQAGLDAGVDVIVEKPLALELEQAEKLYHQAVRGPAHLYVAQVLRFDRRHLALAEAVRQDELRHLSLQRNFQAAAHRVYGRVHPVHNAAIHDLDLAVWLAGRAPKRVTAYASHFFERPTPDCIDLVLEWDDGLRAIVQNSWHIAQSCPYGFEFQCAVQARDATYILRSEPVLTTWSNTEGVTHPELFLWPFYAGARHGALQEELQHFADCSRDRRDSERVPLLDAMATMATCDAALRSLESGSPEGVTAVTPP
jgi:predicted dehydrogenase